MTDQIRKERLGVYEELKYLRFVLKIKGNKNNCWLWTGPLSMGYGLFFYKGTKERAHRYSYRYAKGDIPKSLVIDHLCRNKRCVNPEHLEAVENRVNVLRGVGLSAVNILKTHCIRGHKFNKKNTIKHIARGRPARKCRVCARDYMRIKRKSNGK